jgi:prophage antirepressor-like protein
MENHVITIDDYSLSCMAVEIDGKLWFKARDIAVSLGYKTNQIKQYAKMFRLKQKNNGMSWSRPSHRRVK